MSDQLFNLRGRVVLVTGGTGTLGRQLATALAKRGARVAVLSRNASETNELAAQIRATGAESIGLQADVLVADDLERARRSLLEEWGRLDVLINAAGGNLATATLPPDVGVADLNLQAFRSVVDLNLLGSLLPITRLAPTMVESGHASIITISSMAANRPLTRIAGYSAAKAALENLTRWLAVTLAREYGDRIRVNAVAPGFFVARQNRDLLMDDTGAPTERGQTIIDLTPMGRLGTPDDLVGTVCWLCSDASRFVTGAIVPIDGGFSAFSGV